MLLDGVPPALADPDGGGERGGAGQHEDLRQDVRRPCEDLKGVIRGRGVSGGGGVVHGVELVEGGRGEREWRRGQMAVTLSAARCFSPLIAK